MGPEYAILGPGNGPERGTARVDKENLVRPVGFHFFQQAARQQARSSFSNLETRGIPIRIKNEEREKEERKRKEGEGERKKARKRDE